MIVLGNNGDSPQMRVANRGIRACLPTRRTNPDAATYDLGDWGVSAVLQFGMCRIGAARQRGLGFHSHGSFQITVCTKGVMTFEGANGEFCTLAPGQMLILPPGRLHRLKENARGNMRYWFFVAPRLSPRSFCGLTKLEALSLSTALQGLDRRLYRLPVVVCKILPALFDLVEQPDEPTWERRLRVRELVLRFLLGILSAEPVEDQVVTAISPLVARMRRNPEEDWSIGRLMSLTGCSSTTLTNLFRRETGKTPHRFLVGCRIRRAMGMLKTRRKIIDIAHDLGFGSSQHFATVFLHETGFTPVAWRNGCSKNKS